MSILAFDITQFFPFLNHQLLSLIMNKVGLDYKISTFFKNYLVGRKTKYFWNNFISPFFCVNIGVGQESALSPILSIHYLSPIFYSLENCLKILKIVRRGLHWGGSLQDGLRDEQTCGTTLASAYMLHCLPVMWSQLQMMGRSLGWEWVLNGVLLLNTGDWVQ